MKPSNDADQNFHDNLQAIGRRVPVPNGVSPDVRAECTARLASSPGATAAHVTEFRRNRRLFPALGLAASLILTAGLLITWQTAPTVQAAEIIAALNEQLQDSPVIELTLDMVVENEVAISGHIQISSSGVAGDVNVTVTEDGDESPIHVDASIGLSEGSGWILVRDLDIPDPQARAILSLIMPPGTETLIVLPEGILGESFHTDIDEALHELSSEQLKSVLDSIIESASEVGASVTPQRDGTVLLSVHFEDQETIAAMGAAIVEVLANTGLLDEDDLRKLEDVDSIESALRDEEDLQKLVGGTISIVYDPDAGLVRSLTVEDMGGMQGSVTIEVRNGSIDPDLLDSSRVTTPSTRTLDLAALESMFGDFDLGGRGIRGNAGAKKRRATEDR